MTRQPLPGIDGVLDNLLSPGRTHAECEAGTESPPMKHPSVSDAAEPRSSPSTGARRGRPLGTNRHQGVPKEKVTFRISCDLATAYRDWSWEVRCQLSELVEQALVAYRESRQQRE